jgi:hypothetical protein
MPARESKAAAIYLAKAIELDQSVNKKRTNLRRAAQAAQSLGKLGPRPWPARGLICAQIFKKGQNMSEIFPTSQDLIAQAQTLIYPRFDEPLALALGADLVARAQAAQLGIVISIRTPNRTLFHAALPGSAALNDLWARRKSNVAFVFGQSSLEVGCTLRENGQDLSRHGLPAAVNDAFQDRVHFWYRAHARLLRDFAPEVITECNHLGLW